MYTCLVFYIPQTDIVRCFPLCFTLLAQTWGRMAGWTTEKPRSALTQNMAVAVAVYRREKMPLHLLHPTWSPTKVWILLPRPSRLFETPTLAKARKSWDTCHMTGKYDSWPSWLTKLVLRNLVLFNMAKAWQLERLMVWWDDAWLGKREVEGVLRSLSAAAHIDEEVGQGPNRCGRVIQVRLVVELADWCWFVDSRRHIVRLDSVENTLNICFNHQCPRDLKTARTAREQRTSASWRVREMLCGDVVSLRLSKYHLGSYGGCYGQLDAY